MTYQPEMAVYYEPSRKDWFTAYTDGVIWSKLRSFSGQPYRYLSDRVSAGAVWLATLLFFMVLAYGVAVAAYVIGRGAGLV